MTIYYLNLYQKIIRKIKVNLKIDLQILNSKLQIYNNLTSSNCEYRRLAIILLFLPELIYLIKIGFVVVSTHKF